MKPEHAALIVICIAYLLVMLIAGTSGAYEGGIRAYHLVIP